MRRIGLAILLLPGLSCGGGRTRVEPAPRTASSVITRDDLVKGGFRNAYEAVEALHSNWLVIRNVTPSLGTGDDAGTTTRQTPLGPVTVSRPPEDGGRSQPGMNAGIQVYVDAVRVGGVEELKRLSTHTIQAIRHYTGTEAQTRFGIGHSNGVIAITTSRDTPPG